MDAGAVNLGGRYGLVSLLATGGMGQVWRGRDTVLGRPVAVKVLRSEYTGDPTFLGRFRAEAQHAAALTHPNIATLHDYGEVPAGEGTGEGLAYLVMELVEGESLSALLARQPRLPVERTLELLRQTAAGLAAAHAAGVVHRDVKPGNVLVGLDGVVKITDFGIAWSASDVPLTQTGQVVGTAHYLSPEQAAGDKAGPASDVYALGAIGYECLAGRRLFEGGNPVQIALRHLADVPPPLPVDVPDNVRSLIGRALVKEPGQRYSDGAAFRDAVADVLAGREILPPVPSSTSTTSTTPLALRAGRAGHAPGPVRGRVRRLLAPAVTLVAGAAIGIGALQLLSDEGAQGGAVAAGAERLPAPATGASPSAPSIDPAAFVGRPVDAVSAELTARGLRVRTAPQQRPDLAPGTVVSVSLSGVLATGDEVVVAYADGSAQAAAPSSPATVALVPAAAAETVRSPAPPPWGQQLVQPPVPGDGLAGSPGPGKGPGKDPGKDPGKVKGHGSGKGGGKGPAKG